MQGVVDPIDLAAEIGELRLVGRQGRNPNGGPRSGGG
jgi:hypothetical protein